VTIGTAVLVGAGSGSGSGIPQDLVNGLGVAKNTTAVPLAALIVGVLGVLIISGEYGTGQIRSTFVAAPRRTGVVFAKAAVLALTTFVVSAVATWVGVAASTALEAGHGFHPDVADAEVVLPLVGASVYLTMIALLAFSIGLLVRSSAGGIAVTLGLLLVLPVVLALVGDVLRAQWVADVSQFLPSAAGGQLYHYDFADASGQQGIVLDGWTGFAVLLAEVLVVGALALTVARRRDV
jgi:ABC-2 type transport system permease protein